MNQRHTGIIVSVKILECFRIWIVLSVTCMLHPYFVIHNYVILRLFWFLVPVPLKELLQWWHRQRNYCLVFLWCFTCSSIWNWVWFYKQTYIRAVKFIHFTDQQYPLTSMTAPLTLLLPRMYLRKISIQYINIKHITLIYCLLY